ncbi:DUF1467 family protein [Paenochrobactrum sp. BZR 588]|uniref:DUF1467 family protein n=1 Tax=Paenochrobactrum TaxID=999488 RepID=UPI0035BC7DBD
MSLMSGVAVYFIIWWTALFALLPVGLRTQDDENEVILGTVSSAPARPRIWLAFFRTTIVATILFGLYYYITQMSGFSLDDIPHFYPDLK